MATKVQEVVQVKALSKYGFQLMDGSYVNWGKFLKDEDKNRVVPGGSYEVDLYISDKGSKSANSIGRQVGVVADVPKATTEAKPVAKFVASGVIQHSGRDFDKEARGKTFCQYLSAVLSNPATNFDEIEKQFDMIDKCVARTFGDK